MNDKLSLPEQDNLPAISPYKFINGEGKTNKKSLVNISDEYNYSTIGYYVSLLGEARGLKVIPSSDDLLALHNRNLFYHRMRKNGFKIDTSLDDNNSKKVNIIFGRTLLRGFKTIARKIYSAISVPLLQVKINKEKNTISSVTSIDIQDLSEEEKTIFTEEIKKDEDLLLVRS